MSSEIWNPGSSVSAEQPGDDPKYSSAAQPAVHIGSRRLAFNNVGWDRSSKKHSPARLAEEVRHIVDEKNVDAIGVSEIFNTRDDHLRDAKQQIMIEHLLALNNSAGLPVWEGRADVHYIFLGIQIFCF